MAAAFDYLDNASDWVLHTAAEDPLAAQMADFFGMGGAVRGDIRARRWALVAMPSPCGGNVGRPRPTVLRSYIHARLPLPSRLGCRGHRGFLVVFKRRGARGAARRAAPVGPGRRGRAGGQRHLPRADGPLRLGRGAARPPRRRPVRRRRHAPWRGPGRALPEAGPTRLNTCCVTLAHDLGLRYYAVRPPGFHSRGVGTVLLADLEAALPIWPRPPPRAAPDCSGEGGRPTAQ
jgi:hypothetical protein